MFFAQGGAKGPARPLPGPMAPLCLLEKRSPLLRVEVRPALCCVAWRAKCRLGFSYRWPQWRGGPGHSCGGHRSCDRTWSPWIPGLKWQQSAGKSLDSWTLRSTEIPPVHAPKAPSGPMTRDLLYHTVASSEFWPPWWLATQTQVQALEEGAHLFLCRGPSNPPSSHLLDFLLPSFDTQHNLVHTLIQDRKNHSAGFSTF